MKWPFRRATLETTIWSVVVWFLFGLFVLGPLVTVIAFSFTSSVLSGEEASRWLGMDSSSVSRACMGR